MKRDRFQENGIGVLLVQRLARSLQSCMWNVGKFQYGSSVGASFFEAFIQPKMAQILGILWLEYGQDFQARIKPRIFGYRVASLLHFQSKTVDHDVQLRPESGQKVLPIFWRRNIAMENNCWADFGLGAVPVFWSDLVLTSSRFLLGTA